MLLFGCKSPPKCKTLLLYQKEFKNKIVVKNRQKDFFLSLRLKKYTIEVKFNPKKYPLG